MMYYAYAGNHELGNGPCGTSEVIMINGNFKTDQGAVRNCQRGGATDFRIFAYNNFYDENTFREVTYR